MKKIKIIKDNMGIFLDKIDEYIYDLYNDY